ncbi:MAG: hypothetical protein HYW47_07695 [Deltaproteobacteria bacterium]|nr:hypothetical protein [Deltaproteobacteria bacterium]
MLRASLILFLCGAVLGPVGDLCHVISNTTGYPKEVYAFYFFDLIPFWVPLLFGSACLFIGISHALFDLQSRPGTQQYVPYFGVLFFVGVYSLSGYISYPDIFISFLAVFTWVILDRTWKGILLAIVTAAVGTFIEMCLVNLGAFYYQSHAAHFYGVPRWLPWLYVIASVTVGNLGRSLLLSCDDGFPPPRK